jgi:hypothetical protein
MKTRIYYLGDKKVRIHVKSENKRKGAIVW